MHIFSTSLRRASRSLGLVTVGVLSTLGALSLSHVGSASAQSPGVNLAALVAQVNALQSTVTSQGSTINSLQSNLTAETSRAKSAEAALQTRATTLEAKTAPLSLSGPDLTFSGVNVHIVDGTGSTSSTSGLGNLIIGYNKAGNDQGSGDVRTGSHNLILGDQNNYSSFSGLVAGDDNSISGPYASVSGGFANTASSNYASVSGGFANTASGLYASVSGGGYNTASGEVTSVSGGELDTASGSASSVSGGETNMAKGDLSSVSGGNQNTASGSYASVSGGKGLSESAGFGWAAGSQAGNTNTPTANGNFVSEPITKKAT